MVPSPEELADLVAIPLEAARLILEPPAGIPEQDRQCRLHELLKFPKEQRAWVWEIHKNCDQLLHQRLASFTAAQAMTLASFTVLTVARFGADPGRIPMERIWLLDFSRVAVAAFGIFLAIAGYLVTYPMLTRLDYLNDTFFLPNDDVYRNYYRCIEWDRETWLPVTRPTLRTRYGWTRYAFYRNIIPCWLPIVETALWIALLLLLVFGMLASLRGPQAGGAGFRGYWPGRTLTAHVTVSPIDG